MIQISLKAVAFVIYTVALLAGAFGISYAVFEWLGDSGEASEYVNCTNDALQANVDKWEEHRRVRPEAPHAPSPGTSQAVHDTYTQLYNQFDLDWDRWQDQGDELHKEYDEAVRACGDLLD